MSVWLPHEGILLALPRLRLVMESSYSHTSQNIQRHVDFSVKVPPMTGPVTDPIAHCRLMIEKHFPLSLKVTISVTIT